MTEPDDITDPAQALDAMIAYAHRYTELLERDRAISMARHRHPSGRTRRPRPFRTAREIMDGWLAIADGDRLA